MSPGRNTKAERTRSAILDAALELFRERGYAGTTMRAIAERAGVSVGNAYYYFASKEHLIQGYYARSHEEHLAACEGLEELTDLRERLAFVLRRKIESAEPYHEFAGKLFQTAADPKSPLNPFSAESEPTRDEARALMAEVLAGAKVKVPKDLAAELPELLWLYQMSIILFWIHDDSPDRERTFRLVERTAEIVARLVTLASNPLLRSLKNSALTLLREIRV